MTEPGQGWVPLEGKELLIAVHRILVENPERHAQEVWVGNYFLTPDEVADASDLDLPVDEIRPYALRPINVQPEQPGAVWPVCGSTGCIAGWGAILAAQPGSRIRGNRIILPNGDKWPMDMWVARKMGLTWEQADYLFSPARQRERLIRILDALIEDPTTDVTQVE